MSGSATISASITVDGVTYTDTCEVVIEAAPAQWEEVQNLFDEQYWTGDNYLKQEYTDSTRRTFIEHDGDGNTVSLAFNTDTTSTSTLWLDIQPKPIELDLDNYDYALALGFSPYNADNVADGTVELTDNPANIFTSTWSGMQLTDIVNGEPMPLAIKNATGTRLLTMQVRYLAGTGTGYSTFSAKLMRIRKS